MCSLWLWVVIVVARPAGVAAIVAVWTAPVLPLWRQVYLPEGVMIAPSPLQTYLSRIPSRQC